MGQEKNTTIDGATGTVQIVLRIMAIAMVDGTMDMTMCAAAGSAEIKAAEAWIEGSFNVWQEEKTTNAYIRCNAEAGKNLVGRQKVRADLQSRAEKQKAAILERNPKAVVIDDKAKKEKSLE